MSGVGTAPVTLVVGAAQGIGRAVAEMLAKRGHTLVLADLQEREVTEVAATLNSGGAEVAHLPVDLADPKSIDRLVSDAGPITGLVSAAAVMHSADPLEIERTAFEEVFAVNLIGNYLVAQGCVKSMIAGGRTGSLVVITSAAARRPHPNLPAYSASKAGLTLALRTLALSAAEHGIRINTVAPTATRTGMLASEATARSGVVPAGAVNEPEDIAAAVGFLLDSGSRRITMREFVVDGGTLAGM